MKVSRIYLQEIKKSLLTKRQRQLVEKNGGEAPGWMLKMLQERKRELARFSEQGANFRVGQEKVYLPDFVVALMRTPHLPASQAQFRVPLHFTKLDLRDYLFHAYDVRIHGVRSWITGSKINPRWKNPDPEALLERIKERGGRELSNRLKREVKNKQWTDTEEYMEQKAQKFMVVDLEKPFIWPPKPTEEEMDLAMGPELRHMRASRKRMEEVSETRRDEKVEKEEQDVLAKQAALLREGKVMWRGNEGMESREIKGQVTTIERAPSLA